MSVSLNVLVLEDRSDDAELMVHELHRAGFDPEWERVETESDYLAHLDPELDVILADYTLPQFDALRALHLLQAQDLDVPLIVVAGSVSEEVAVACMKEGAADYLLKDRLARLGEAVRHALNERRLRQEKRQAQAALRRSEERFRRLAENAPDIIFRYQIFPELRVEYINPAAAKITGYPPEAFYKNPDLLYELIHPEDRVWLSRLLDGKLADLPVVVRFRHKDGTIRWVERRSVLVHDEEGKPVALEGIMRDITERKQAEEALREREELYRTLVQTSPDAISLTDLKGTILICNQQAAVLHGYASVQELVGRNALEFVTAEDRERMKVYTRQILAEGSVRNVEYHLIKKDGTRFPAELSASLFRDAEGNPTAFINVVRDITAREQAARALRESQRRLQALFENAQDAILLTDDQARYIDANPAACALTGYSRQELLQLSVWDITPVPNRELGRGLWLKFTAEAEQSGEYTIVRKDGNTVEIEYRSVANIVPGMHLTVWRDISERKRAEEAVREQRALAEALGDTAAALNSTLNLDNVLERILDNVGRVVPHDGANIMLIESEVARIVRCHGYYTRHGFEEALMRLRMPMAEVTSLCQMAESGQPFVVPNVGEYSDWLTIPETSWIRSYVGAPISQGGEVIGFLNLDSATADFFNAEHAQRLQAFADHAAIALRNARLYQGLENYSVSLEEAVAERTAELQRTTEQVEAILSSSPDPILLLDANGIIETGNSAFIELFGYQVDEIPGRMLHYLMTPAHGKVLSDALRAVVEDEQKVRLEVVAQRKDGVFFDTDMALAPVTENGAVVGIVCSLRDISSFKEIERMKDAFVSNVSHELRTPIANLKLNHDLIQFNPKKSDVYMERLGREIDRLNAIIEDLLRLSRLEQGRVEMELTSVDLNRLMRQYVDDQMPLARKKRLALTVDQEPELTLTQADPGLIRQVLSILLTNALNYTPSGGQVSVGTQMRQQGGKPWVGFRVSDTGPGIPAEERPHVFERFFRGQAGLESGMPGTGLGLSIAQKIVKEHKGQIEVGNNGVSGKGATFEVWLLAEDEESQPAAETH